MPVPTSLWVPAFFSSLSTRSLSVHYNLVLFSLLFLNDVAQKSRQSKKNLFVIFSFPLFKIKIGLFISVGVKFLKTTKIDDIVWLFVKIWRVFPDKYQERFFFIF
jgi:hypothetical protein